MKQALAVQIYFSMQGSPLQLEEAGSAPTPTSSALASGKHPVAGSWSLSLLQQPAEGRSTPTTMLTRRAPLLHTVLAPCCRVFMSTLELLV